MKVGKRKTKWNNGVVVAWLVCSKIEKGKTEVSVGIMGKCSHSTTLNVRSHTIFEVGFHLKCFYLFNSALMLYSCWVGFIFIEMTFGVRCELLLWRMRKQISWSCCIVWVCFVSIACADSIKAKYSGMRYRWNAVARWCLGR